MPRQKTPEAPEHLSGTLGTRNGLVNPSNMRTLGPTRTSVVRVAGVAVALGWWHGDPYVFPAGFAN